jgi:hypothetical protein
LHLSLASWLEQALTPASSWSQDRCRERAGADQTRALGTTPRSAMDSRVDGRTCQADGGSIRSRSFRPAVALPPLDDTRTDEQSRMLIATPQHPDTILLLLRAPSRSDWRRTRKGKQPACRDICSLAAPGSSQEQLPDVRLADAFDAGEPCATFRLILRRAAGLRTRGRRPHASH